jgi:hypothetical protein
MAAPSIKIPLSKNKLLLSIGGSLLFVMAAAWMLVTQAGGFSGLPPIVAQITGIAGILFFSVTGILGVTKLFDKTPGLIIDDRGITDNSSAAGVGLIEWKDMTGIRTRQIMTTRFLLIDVADPEKYITRAGSGGQALLMRANGSLSGTPLSIASTALQCDFAELERTVLEEYWKHKHGKRL